MFTKPLEINAANAFDRQELSGRREKPHARDRAPERAVNIAGVIVFTLSLLPLAALAAPAGTPAGLTLFGTRGRGDQQFMNPEGLAFHADGTLLVADSGNRSLKEYTLEGGYLGSYDGQAPSLNPEENPDVDDPMALNQALARERTPGNARNAPFGNVRMVKPTDVAVGPDGSIYIVDSGARRVEKFDRELKPLLNFGGPVAPAAPARSGGAGETAASGRTGATDGRVLGLPASIAVDKGGTVYVTDAEKHCVDKFSAAGALLASWGNEGQADGQFQQPWGIAVDGSGDVWVADWGNNRVQKFSPDGRHLLTVSGSPGGEPLEKPSDVAVGPQDTIWVLNWQSGRIHVLTDQGVAIRATQPQLNNIARGAAEGRLVALAVSDDGRIFLTDSLRSVVAGFDPNQARNPRLNRARQRPADTMTMEP